MPSLTVDFAVTKGGRRPVLDWLRSLDPEDRRIVGADIRRVQDHWPLGAPLCKCLNANSDI